VIAPTYPDLDETAETEADVLRVPALQNFNGSDFSVTLSLPAAAEPIIDAFSPDIIHSHHPFLIGDSALRTARRRGLPLVFTHHTLYEKYTHYVPFSSKAMKRFVIHLSTQYANLCDGVVAPSRSIWKLIRNRGVRTPIREIPTGIDIRLIRNGNRNRFRERHGIPADALVIGHIGRLAPEKNLGYLASAVSDFLLAFPRALFLVVGAGASEPEIAGIVAAAGLTDRLVLAGKKTGDELSDAYMGIDIFVFSSRTETQGMVLAEAMAAGKPVIALDASGVREVVQDGRNGRLLPAKAPPGLFSTAIRELAEDPQKIARWGRAAMKTSSRFSRDRCAERLCAFYRTLSNRAASTAGMSALDSLILSLKTEWDLLAEKASAAVSTLVEEPRDPGGA
jgi:glycosyltransferase involved in cell wall biosynthesis